MIALILSALLAQAVPASSSSPVPSTMPESSAAPASGDAPVGRMPATFPPMPAGAAVIRNSGSTNSAGYTVILAPDGSATVRQYDGFAQKLVGAPQTHWLFLKLRQAAPLATLGNARCVKSVSFGSSTTVSWNDSTSGDLSCGGDPRSRELARTIGVIVRELDISLVPRARRLYHI